MIIKVDAHCTWCINRHSIEKQGIQRNHYGAADSLPKKVKLLNMIRNYLKKTKKFNVIIVIIKVDAHYVSTDIR